MTWMAALDDNGCAPRPVVVDNRPGAGTAIGGEVVAKAPADGYTLLFSDSTTFVALRVSSG